MLSLGFFLCFYLREKERFIEVSSTICLQEFTIQSLAVLPYNKNHEKESKIAGHNSGLFTAYGMLDKQDVNRRDYHGWAIQYGWLLDLLKTFE